MTWYDRAELYDLWFSWPTGMERNFVLGASERWGRGARPARTLEPFCGSGRLLAAMPGFVVGFDCNPRMLALASSRGRVFRGDAARFGVAPASFDLAHCLIDSFRYLLSDDEASTHLRCIAHALRPGAVYVLGFDVTGDIVDHSVETWSMERDGRFVRGTVRCLGDADPVTRLETAHVRIETGRRGDDEFEVIEDFSPQRVYTARQVEDLIDEEGSFEIEAVFDRHYDLSRPIELSDVEGSAVLVLRRDDSR